MTVTCITCDNFSLRTAGDMAKRGFGNCKHRDPWVFHPATRLKECELHLQTAAQLIEERRAWIEKQKGTV